MHEGGWRTELLLLLQRLVCWPDWERTFRAAAARTREVSDHGGDAKLLVVLLVSAGALLLVVTAGGEFREGETSAESMLQECDRLLQGPMRAAASE